MGTFLEIMIATILTFKFGSYTLLGERFSLAIAIVIVLFTVVVILMIIYVFLADKKKLMSK